jgi:hypothetical protein
MPGGTPRTTGWAPCIALRPGSMLLQPVSQGLGASRPVVDARVLRLAQRASMRGVSHETPEPSTPPENPSETLGNPWKASGKRVLPGVLHPPLLGGPMSC